MESQNSGMHVGLINRQSSSTIQSVDPNAPAPPKERLRSIDVYRGLTMFGMILVDTQADWKHVFWALDHSSWNGISTADLIFPSFLFIMGFAIPLAVRPPFKPLRFILRVLGLFLIGFFLNLMVHKFDFTIVRILGVLQRLSLCYAIVAAIHLATKFGEEGLRRYGAMFVGLLLSLYMGFMLSFQNGCSRSTNLDPHCNFSRWLDLKILTIDHIMKPTDPEGFFSTLSAVVTVYGGYTFCLIMKNCRGDKAQLIKKWLSLAIFCVLFSLPISMFMPYNKKIWSASFALVTVGISGAALTLTMVIVDILAAPPKNFIVVEGENRLEDPSFLTKTINFLTSPFVWLGMNPLVIYVLMMLSEIILDTYVKVDGTTGWVSFYHKAFSSWISDSYWSNAVFSLFWAISWTIVALILYKLKIFIKL